MPAPTGRVSGEGKRRLDTRLRRQRQVERICRTPRPVFELLAEFDRHHDLGADLDRRLARYAAFDLGLLQFLGGDTFAPMPLHPVEASR
jgi:hypothetical protein